ncbi:carboxypeptidase regulatory-like domain-containing protein [Tahibacter sp.]|uniref:beta strand repeat-containing protein n=1 Tax=Tahibacter sp. TaxID=2056211 RepID=UPI0028C490F6|nr:carboxypeptidase regulatory-like domain-containing protein [Tahibacter sp.]
MTRGASRALDLRSLPQNSPRRRERPEHGDPPRIPLALPGGPAASPELAPARRAPAPPPIANFEGLDFSTWGSGHPPDTNGDVGPVYYIQAINSSIGIYRKSDGVREAAFSFDTLMSQGNIGNLCDTANFGDPVVLYDTFEDRWILTDFAFELDGGNNVINPPGAFQCFAVSLTGNPLTGGWAFYSINTTGGLGDYPKLGIWPDGIYMSVNMFGYASGAAFQGSRVYALNKAQMYAAQPTVQVVSFDAPAADFTLLPANARLQTGTPPPGRPNYFVSSWQFLNGLTVYEFRVNWERVSQSTFTGPSVPLAGTSWPNATVPNAPALGGTAVDVLPIRAMMQNQYTNFGGVESLWNTHTVRRANTTGFAAPRWYQADVTGGIVAAALPQAATWDPDGANVLHRFMPSLALNRAGDMVMGYSTSSSTTKPAIAYAGRLASDPVNTFSQTEQLLIQGTGAQVGSARWGDYSSMTLDPDGCTFWYTNQYYVADGLNYQTRIGSFAFPSCTPVGAGGTVSGTITAQVGGTALAGATVALGSRVTTTDANGLYQFSSIPAGTYPLIVASRSGYVSASANSLVVADAATTTQNLVLDSAATAACPIDTTRADFQAGLQTAVDVDIQPDSVVLQSAMPVDQQNTTLGTQGAGTTATTWLGQTFTPAITGPVVKVDLNLFSLNCAAVSMPNLTVSIRNAAANLPTGADLATATIGGFCNGAGAYFTATFAPPVTLTAGTQYALVWRPASPIPAGTPAPGYFGTVSAGTGATALQNPYAGGRRASSSNSGSTWAGAAGTANNDHGFRLYVDLGYVASGEQTSALKDTNPVAGAYSKWTTLSWTGTEPTDTALRFQAAASNQATGPFNFVGPDGTAASYFSSGASLAQFNGQRYLRYRANLSSTNPTATPSLGDATVCYTALAPPDLSLTKSEGGVSASPGGSVAYTLTYRNNGAADATGTVLTETVPPNSTFNAGASTAGWVCAPDNNAGAICTLAVGSVTAAAGPQTATFAVTVVSPLATGVTALTNTASVADDGTSGTDPTPADNSASDSTPLNAAPDLTASKSDGGVSVAPGGTVAYTLTFANAGNQGATGVVLTETVPANTQFNAGVSSPGWVCAPNNNAGSSCTLNVGALSAGSGNQTRIFGTTVAGSVPAGVSQIANTCSLADDGTNGPDPTPGNNSGSDATPLNATPDLTVSKSDGGATVAPGGTVAYTLTYANTGNQGATGVVLSETVPANTQFNAGASTAGWVCAPNNNAGSSCTLSIGALSAGSGNQTTTFAATVLGSVPAGVSQISNSCSLADDGSNGVDPTPANNSASDTTPVNATPDLTVSKSDGGASAAPGGTVAYSLIYANVGNQGATGVVLTETVPQHSTFNPGASTAGWVCAPNNNAGSSCTLSVGSVTAATGTQSATFAVTVVNPLPAGVAALTNNASIADNGTNGVDPTPANNSGGDTTPLNATPDLTVSKSDGGATVAPGGTVAYTLTYANTGNQGATGVVLSETVPQSSTFNAGASTAGWVCAPNNNAGSSCTLSVGALSAGSGNQTTTFAVTVSGAIPAGVSQIANSCSIADDSTNGVDPTTANNTAGDTTPLDGADLSVTKSDGVVSAVPGSSVTYTITATNAGPQMATAATVADPFPAALTCTWTCAGSGGGTCTAAGSGTINDTVNLPAAASVIYTATCAIDPTATGTLVNTATVTAAIGTLDLNLANNTATDTDTLQPSADLALSMTDNRSVVGVGRTINYIIAVTNSTGPSTATATVNDVLPPGLYLASWICLPYGGASCSDGTGTTMNTPATLPVGSGVTYVYSSTVFGGDANDQISNTATVTSTGSTDNNPANDSATDVDTLAIFIDGFGDGPLTHILEPLDPAGVRVRIAPALLQELSSVPLIMAAGESANGAALFRLELVRFRDVALLRIVTSNAVGHDERSTWHRIDASFGLLGFEWRAASAGGRDGYLAIDMGDGFLRIENRTEADPLVRLRTGVFGNVPWMTLPEGQ